MGPGHWLSTSGKITVRDAEGRMRESRKHGRRAWYSDFLKTMATEKDRRFKTGLLLCWGALALVPLGLLAIGGGPCAGPRNAAGSSILLFGGVAGLILAVYGISHVLRGIKAANSLMRVWGAFSACCAGFAGFAGAFYLLMGIYSLEAFIR
jgi:hypothetical protein